MRLLLLTALTMVAFAANSVLNRVALAGGHIDAAPFGTMRLFAGAAILVLLVAMKRERLTLFAPGRLVGLVSLLAYIYGFSAAYAALDAGVGALVLFGMVQLTMFAGGLATGERPPPARWAGAALASAGLIWLLWPASGPEVSPFHAMLMAIAGIGWGIYSLAGRAAGTPIASTAANFVLAAPIGLLMGFLLPFNVTTVSADMTGILCAVLSGAVTSGMGYALWYSLLPKLSASMAAVAQLTVPAIAMLGGALVLDELISVQLLLASVVILAGVALSAFARPRP